MMCYYLNVQFQGQKVKTKKLNSINNGGGGGGGGGGSSSNL